jgi:hypothetical protein
MYRRPLLILKEKHTLHGHFFIALVNIPHLPSANNTHSNMAAVMAVQLMIGYYMVSITVCALL